MQPTNSIPCLSLATSCRMKSSIIIIAIYDYAGFNSAS